MWFLTRAVSPKGRVAAVAPLVAVVSACGGQPAEKAAADVRVIDVTGLRYADARSELRDLGIDVRRETAQSDARPGEVIEQSAAPGSTVAADQSITLTVSAGAATSTAATPTPAGSDGSTWADVYSDTHNGVVRVDATFCDADGTGSGFLVGRNLVATNAHVVEDNVGVRVVAGGNGRGLEGTVVGIDEPTDLALIRVDESLDGHVFETADAQPRVGSEVAAMGYPLGEPLSLVQGTVSGLDRHLRGEGANVAGLVQTDAAVNPGNSGGPLIDPDGKVVGIIVAGLQYTSVVGGQAVARDAEGLAYAIPSTTAFPMLDQWRDNDSIVSSPTCDQPAVDTGSPDAPPPDARRPADPVRISTDHPEGAALADTFDAYSTGINAGDYWQAYDRWSPRMQSRIAYDDFVREQSTSVLHDLEIMDVHDASADRLRVHVNFWSEQSAEYGHDGQTCSVWALNYEMVRSASGWLIDGAKPISDGIPYPCH